MTNVTQTLNPVLIMPAATANPSPSSERLMSIDALRGFDMFWIIGAEGLVSGLRKISSTGILSVISDQLEHKNWEGLAFEDLIFPLFVFLAGVSMVFSLSKNIEREGKAAAYKRLIQRGVVLYLIGIFYYGGFTKPWPGIRLLGVLQRIALSSMFAGFIFTAFKLPGRIAAFVIILVGYWAMMTFVPVPVVDGKDTNGKDRTVMQVGNFAEKKNLANYIDKMYLPGFKWDGDHDPEGLLSTLPAIATCLMGMFAGMLLKNKAQSENAKVGWLVAAGVAAIGLGLLWNLQFPIIKKIWTSSYVLVAGGYGCILLALFYWIIDICKYRKWSIPFVWIGMNSITIYLAERFFPFGKLAGNFVGGDIHNFLGIYGDLVHEIVALALIVWLAQFLYSKKIFLRV